MQNSGLILFVCAGLLLSGGAILGGSTTWSLIRISYYFWVTDLGVELASSILYICGALLCLPTCWLATLVPYQPRSLSLSATLLILASSAMVLLAAGMSSATALSHALRDRAALNDSMLRSMGSIDPAVQSAYAAMQIELRCCGVESYSDWYRHRSTLPPSCCGRITNVKGESCESSFFAFGCLRRVALELRAYINSLTILASVIVIILAVTLFAGAYTLVSSAAERGERGKPPALRIACVAPPLAHLAHYPPPHAAPHYNPTPTPF
ncbi:uncharacterized protein [Epargyreus clarus]|uniref:uncharacterized protein n=1 Tax=Epargyreus clarus TaxID=520877 RepID=UPI003C2E7D6C